MKQHVKYGLVQPLRPFELPETWTGTEHVSVSGARKEGDTVVVEQDGEVHIARKLNGTAQTAYTIKIMPGVKTKIIETLEGSGTVQSRTTVFVASNATVEYAILQNLDESSIAVLDYTASMSNAKLRWFFCGVGADTTQATLHTDAGENSEVVNNAVICGDNNQQFDIHVATKHIGSHSRSDMLTRSVLDGNSRAIYHGLIHIAPEASDVDSYQKDEVILLSEDAGADAIPNLEIHNHHVRCTHGASIGKLDEEKLFYLKSRGVTSTEAKRMITQGFLDELFIVPWQTLIHDKISRS